MPTVQNTGRALWIWKRRLRRPIDGLRLASSSSFNSLTPVGISKLSLSSSMQNKILKALPKTVTAFDALNRPFEYSTENLVNTTHASNANLRNAVSRLAMGGAKKTVKDERTGFPLRPARAWTTAEGPGWRRWKL